MMLFSVRPWSAIPITFIVFAIILGIGFYYFGKHFTKSSKIFNRVIFCFGLVLLVMEITHEVNRYIELGRYDWSSFPFQLCSVSMYLSLLVPFIKEGKIKNSFNMFFALFTTLSGILPLGFGQSNLTRWPNFIGVFFSFAWHVILLIEGLYALGYTNTGKSFKSDYKSVLGSFAIFFSLTCIAQLLNVILHYGAGAWALPEGISYKEINYVDKYVFDPDSASLFYISPYFASNIPVVFGSIWKSAGWGVCWISYVLAFCFGGFVVYGVTYGCRYLYNYIESKHKAIIEVKSEEREILKVNNHKGN